MKVITALETYRKPLHVFLAGGIKGCPDWQKTALHLLTESTKDIGRELVVFNPRRPNWDALTKEDHEEQVIWEHNMLMAADAHIFWFPPQTLCPITLYELGKVPPLNRPLFVGCHPDYMRRDDVIFQLSLIRRDVIVRDNLTATVLELGPRCLFL